MALSILFAISLFFAGFYIWIINSYIKGWNALPHWVKPKDFKPSTSISILIPARNEEEHIAACLQSIIDNDYPNTLLEIIVIDDFSEDQTAKIAASFPQVKVLQLAQLSTFNRNAHKKAALAWAIEQSNGQLIISTDADVIVQKNWLEEIVSYHEIAQKDFIAAPVNFHKEQSLLERFQSLDFIGMMGLTAAGIHSNIQLMCNGANLAFTKAIYQAVDGYKGIDNIASGDDMLLMHKVHEKAPTTIGFLKSTSATVFTSAKKTYKSFYWQRIRWATKNGGLQDQRVTFILGGIYLYCIFLLALLISIPFYSQSLYFFTFLLFIKTIQDYRFLRMSSLFFNRLDLLKDYLLQQIMHILYIIVIGTMAQIVKEYEWKGRKVK